MIPIKYNIRNLRVRWVTTLLTVLGTALVVWSSCILFGMVEGLRHSLNVSGDPNDLLVMRKGSSTETNSFFDQAKADRLKLLDGVARDPQGQPIAAAETTNIPVVERFDGQRTNLIIRGVEPPGSVELRRSTRPQPLTVAGVALPDWVNEYVVRRPMPGVESGFEIVEGRMFKPASGEAIVSKLLAGRYKGAVLGGVLQVGEKESYRVVGLFTSGGGVAESEVWVDRADLDRNTGRQGYCSAVQLRAATPADVPKLRAAIADDPQFRLEATPEADYYKSQSLGSEFLKWIGVVIAVLLTSGAMFAAANTMFAAVKTRVREIGTMRALGFSQFDVLICFMGESILLCALGGLLGLLATLPLTALSIGTTDFSSFTERTVQFRVGPLVAIAAIAMTTAMGVIGGVFPALRAVRMKVIDALREM